MMARPLHDRRRVARLVAILVPLLLLLPPALADDPPVGPDRIHLQNGKLFTGRIVAETADSVTLEMTSDSGGCGRMLFPRRMIKKIERGVAGSAPRTAPGCVRDAWYLLKSGGAIVGARHLVLRHVRSGGVAGWRLEQLVEQFSRGRHVPPVKEQWTERVDLAFRPLQIYYREVGEGSPDPHGPRRYETTISGSVSGGMLEALLYSGEESERKSFALPSDGRSRLGTREHMLRNRVVGLHQATLFDPAGPRTVTVLAGYTALDVIDQTGKPYDEFVWEEAGSRLVSRLRACEVLEEQVAEGVVAVPATEAQVDAARESAGRQASDPEPGVIRLAELGIAYRLPDATWKVVELEANPLASGWRKVAEAQSRPLLADLRVEWNPDGAVVAPSAAEAADRLLQRLRSVCPDLQVVHTRRDLSRDTPGHAAWRMDFLGTLKGERVRTVAVVLDQGKGRALFLVACPDVSWTQASRSIESLVGSIRQL